MERRTTAGHNVCAQIDFPLGELGLALLHNHTQQFGKRKRRGSNAPSKNDWLKMHAGKDPSSGTKVHPRRDRSSQWRSRSPQCAFGRGNPPFAAARTGRLHKVASDASYSVVAT